MSNSDVTFLIDGPNDAEVTFIFAHGAGAPMDSPFMSTIAQRLAQSGVRVLRFEFPYMAVRREGRKKGPDRTDVLMETWRDAIEAASAPRRLYIGGKSLGGRIATMIARDADVAGVVCFGYPFHPPGKPEKLRTAHLSEIEVPVLILQGERDPFGTPDEVSKYDLSPAVSVEWIPDGDHSLKPRKRSGHTNEANLELSAQRTLELLFKKRSLV